MNTFFIFRYYDRHNSTTSLETNVFSRHNPIQQQLYQTDQHRHQQQPPINDITDEDEKMQQQRRHHRRLSTKSNEKERILYVITTLAEYNTGDRSTVRGSDRLQETTIPIMTESISSMITYGYDVDLYMVCHFTLSSEREQLIRNSIKKLSEQYHTTIGFDIWYDATPLGYDTSKKPHFVKLEYRTLHLAREHRFVIKDRFMAYDIFVNFEDDMYISGEHIQHYVAVSNELYSLYEKAPDENPSIHNSRDATKTYYGLMTKGQLKRMIPGFMRVEVLLDEAQYGAQTKTGPIPIDMFYNDEKQPFEVNSTICCHVSSHIVNDNRPMKPKADQVMIWETNIFPLGVREMPKSPYSWLDWVLMQRGPNQIDIKNPQEIIGDYWTNQHHKYYPDKKSRPAGQEFKYINNQGGWMGIQKQLVSWHTEICLGSFLPPYNIPHYQFDGLDMRNVEWYSGGMQLSTIRHACNMQRIIQLHPYNFSKSLLYHTANNKQRQLSHKREEFFTKANTLLGQLNTIKKNAAAEIPK